MNTIEEENCVNELLDVDHIDENLALTDFPISEQERLELENAVKQVLYKSCMSIYKLIFCICKICKLLS